MEKLFNWTIGSFFRTIGRLIAYFAIGAFIAYILGHSNIDLGGITNLFYTKVNASSVNSFYSTDKFYYNGQQFTTSTIWGYSAASLSSDLNQVIRFGDANGVGLDLGFTDISDILFSIRLKGSANYNDYTEDTQCTVESSVHHPNSSGSMVDDAEYTIDSLTCSTDGWTSSTNTYSVSFRLYSTNAQETIGGWNYCKINYQNIDNNGASFITLECPVWTGAQKIKELVIATSKSLSSISIGNDLTILRRDNTADSINSNNNANHQETMTIVTDTNTTQEQNETTTFFEGFQFSSDNNGLVGVITAPLRVFTAISEGTFSDLCFTLKGKQTCFPNGNMIWQKTERTSSFFGSGSIATGIQAFVTLFNLVAGGYLLYKMGASVKRLTEELIDPTNTRIEVMKL